MKRGQYFSFDAIIASLIFILTIVSLLSYWYSVHSQLDYQNYEMMKEAVRVSDLAMTPGTWKSWQPGPFPSTCDGLVDQLGFATSWEDRRLDATKIVYAQLVCQDEAKRRFNTAYNISIVIRQIKSLTPLAWEDAQCIGQCINDNKDPDIGGASNIAKMTRAVSIETTPRSGKFNTGVMEVYIFN